MIEEKSIQTERGQIYYWINDNIVNSETCIVFCHGLTADHSLFDMQISAFENINRILLLDIPLHGKSSSYQNFTFQNVVSDLKLMFEKEGIEKVIFVGQSAGGYVAQAFIDKYPENVIGFVGIGTTPFGLKYYKKSELFWIKHYATIAKLYPYSYYCKAGAKLVSITKKGRENMYVVLKKLGKRKMLEIADAVYGEFFKVENQIKYPFPILLTYGEFDNIGLVKKYNHQWAKTENAELQVIPNAAHNANYDNFDEFNKLLSDYINKIARIYKQ